MRSARWRPAQLWTPAEAATSRGSLPRQVDVVVVGGGLSGLVGRAPAPRRRRVGARRRGARPRRRPAAQPRAARRLGHRVRRRLRRARPRTTSSRWREELKVKTFKEYVEGNNIYVKGPLAIPYTGTIPPDPTILADAGILQARIDQMASEIAVDAPWEHPNAKEWDEMSFATWVRQNTVNPDVRTLLLCYTQAAFGSDGEDFSLLFVVWYVATAGDETHVGTFERSSGTEGAAQDSRFVGGSQLVPLRLAKQLGDRVALNAAVRRIVQAGDHVDVHTDRGKVRAKRVVVACPPVTVLGIDWQPILPQRRNQLLQRMPMGALMKCDAVYETPFWRDAGLSGSGLNTTGAVRTSFDNSPPDGSVGVLLSFVGGSTWRQYGLMTKAKRRKAVLEGFAAIVGREGAATRSSTSSTTGPRSAGPRAARWRSRCPARSRRSAADPRAVRPRALGRHRDLDVLGRLHGRRGACRQARCDRSAGPAVTSRRAAARAVVGAGRAVLLALLPAVRASSARRHRASAGTPRVLATVQSPGYPAFVYAHPNGRVYAGTYSNPTGDTIRVPGPASGRGAARSSAPGPCPARTSTAGARRAGRHQRRPRPARGAGEVDVAGAQAQHAHRPLLDVLPAAGPAHVRTGLGARRHAARRTSSTDRRSRTTPPGARAASST